MYLFSKPNVQFTFYIFTSRTRDSQWLDFSLSTGERKLFLSDLIYISPPLPSLSFHNRNLTNSLLFFAFTAAGVGALKHHHRLLLNSLLKWDFWKSFHCRHSFSSDRCILHLADFRLNFGLIVFCSLLALHRKTGIRINGRAPVLVKTTWWARSTSPFVHFLPKPPAFPYKGLKAFPFLFPGDLGPSYHPTSSYQPFSYTTTENTFPFSISSKKEIF